MNDARLAAIARSMRVTLDPHRPAGSMSGSEVHRAFRTDGTPAILKVTLGSEGPQRDAADRELAVYTDLRSTIGVRTPDLLDHRVTADDVSLLLTAHEAILPPPEWSHRNWLDLAGDLARLHRTPAPPSLAPGQPSWLINMLNEPNTKPLREYWAQPGEPEMIDTLLAEADRLISAITAPARCLVHGDCHTDNILIENDRLIWTDWQGVGIGDPGAELAFVSVRAVPSGAVPPLAEMISSYARDRAVDADLLARAVLAAELAILVVAWPEYACYNTADGNSRVRRRVQTLARNWSESPDGNRD